MKERSIRAGLAHNHIQKLISIFGAFLLVLSTSLLAEVYCIPSVYNLATEGGTNPGCNGCGCGTDGPTDPGPSGAGEPVELVSGHWYYSKTDLNVNGVFPIRMQRYYHSAINYDSPLGFGWGFSYDKRLYRFPDGKIIIRNRCGYRAQYTLDAGTYIPPKGYLHSLEEQPDGSFVLRSKNNEQQIFDIDGKLTSIVDTRGNQLEISYDLIGLVEIVGSSPHAVNPAIPQPVAKDYRITKIEERLADGTLSGNFVDVVYHSNINRVQKVVASDGREVIYGHDLTESEKHGNLNTVLGLEGILSTFKYEDTNDSHNVTSIQVGAGSTPYVNIYDTLGRVTSQTFGRSTIAFNYLIPGMETRVTKYIRNAAGATIHTAVTLYEMNEIGQPERITDALGHQTLYEFNADFRAERKERWENNSGNLTLLQAVEMRYDDNGNKRQEWVDLDSGERVTKTWTHDHNWIESEEIVSSLEPTKIFRTEYKFYYGTDGHPTNIREQWRQKNDGSFQTTGYVYDNLGRLEIITLPDDVNIVNTYLGAFVESTYYEVNDAEVPHRKQTFGYDTQGNRDRVWDAKNNLTTTQYDDLGRVETITNPLLQTTIYRYTEDLLTETEVGQTAADGEGQVTRFIYTPEKWREKIQRKDDNGVFQDYMSSTFDSEGSVLTQTDAMDRTTTYTYDKLNRRSSVRDALQNTTTFGYDGAGNQNRITDALQRDTISSYDDLNRLVRSDKMGVTPIATTVYAYDALGSLLTVIDPEQSTTTYEYDLLSRRTAVIQPLLQTTSYTYDDRDRVDTIIDAEQQRIVYDYFDWGPVQYEYQYLTLDNNSLDRTITQGYDLNGNLTSASDDSIQTSDLYTITHDQLNRIDIKTVAYIPGGDKTLDYGYDRYGNRNSLVLDDGAITENAYQFNKLNRLSVATLAGSPAYGFSYYYNDDLWQLDYPNGVTSTYTYKLNGPIDAISIDNSNGNLETFGYEYDAVLNIDTQQDNSGVHDYGYDGLDRLTSAVRPAGSALPDESYSYDLVGNREDPGDSTEYDYDSNHRIAVSPGRTYAFNQAGNMLSQGTGETLTYDVRNRLGEYLQAGVSSSYVYDINNQRLGKSTPSGSVFFLYDGAINIAEYDGAGQRTRFYGNLNPSIVSVQVSDDQNVVGYVHSDHISTPRLVTETNGEIIWRANFQSFGEATIDEDVDGDSNNFVLNIRFPGQYFDEESGFFYNWNRYYDPRTGRYLSSDPIGLDGGLNTYGYVFGNPVKNIDPQGLVAYLICRPLAVVQKIHGARPVHCFVFIGCEDEGWAYVLSLFGDTDQSAFPNRGRKHGYMYPSKMNEDDDPFSSVNSYAGSFDKNAGGGCESDQCKCERDVLSNFMMFPVGWVNYKTFGPNSNSFAADLVRNSPNCAGMPSNAPGAFTAPGINQSHPGTTVW